jgi:hypothetical protein
MIRQFKHSRILRYLGPGEMRLAHARHEHRWPGPSRSSTTPASVTKFPRRPGVVSEAIPLFYVGRNNSGLWVVRGAEGCSGGLFFFRPSATRFARRQSEPAGCAMMFLAEPFELDVANQGSRFAGLFNAVREVVARRAPLLATFIGSAIAEWRKLIAMISGVFSSQCRHRAAIEQELFHGQYTLSSKTDDDLPIP